MCEHDNTTFIRIDKANAPESLYHESRCNDCEALISREFKPTGRWHEVDMTTGETTEHGPETDQ